MALRSPATVMLLAPSTLNASTNAQIRVRDLARLDLEQIAHLSEHIKTLEARMADEAEKSAVAARLRGMAGIVITCERDCRKPAAAVC